MIFKDLTLENPEEMLASAVSAVRESGVDFFKDIAGIFVSRKFYGKVTQVLKDKRVYPPKYYPSVLMFRGLIIHINDFLLSDKILIFVNHCGSTVVECKITKEGVIVLEWRIRKGLHEDVHTLHWRRNS
jgi:hypothetical protein